MSWVQVDFTLVRYSPIEGTHYFFDPAYPTAIQFLLNGRWEPWDVGWVKHKAQDPEIKRIADNAEARLIFDPTSGYRGWPSSPAPGTPSVDGQAHSQSSIDSPLPSPSFQDFPPNSAQNASRAQIPRSLPPVTPQAYNYAGPSQPPSYTSPYGPDPAPPISRGPEPTTATSAPTPTVALSPSIDPTLTNGVQQQHALAPPPPPPPPDPVPQPVAAPPVLLPRNRETKILLSLDGDGVRGLSQVLLVESLVNAICTKVGRQVDPYQIFDLIGGTSLGGVLAIMLSRLRMQAHSAREAYKAIAKEVFWNKRDFFTSFDPHAPPIRHDGQAVEDAIKRVVSQETGNQEDLLYDSRDESADVFVVSTRIDIGTNKAALMRSYQTRRITGPELDANMTIWQAMRATVVAPKYMQPRSGVNWRPVIEPGLVDHGTSKNNPIRDILYECRKLFRYANDMMVIVSIGTGTGMDWSKEVAEMAKSVADRNLEASVCGEKFEADHQALMERGWMKFFRFNVRDLDDVPLEEWCHEDQLKEKTLAYLGRPEVGQAFYACVDAITSILVGSQPAR